MIQQTLTALEICSKCISHEINSWIIDQGVRLNPEITKQVAEELRAIKLAPGKCIVCNHDIISQGVIENIIKVFEKNKVSEVVQKEFKNLFCIIN